MLNWTKTRISDSRAGSIAAATPLVAEGQALTVDNASGDQFYKPAGSSDRFAGIAFDTVINQPDIIKEETVIPNASGVVTLSFTPVLGTIYGYDNTAAAALSFQASGTASATLGNVSANTITFTSADSGHSMTFRYRTNISALQSAALVGNQQPGGPAGSFYGRVGVGFMGEFYTDQFDTTVDWSSAPYGVKLAAGGKFTKAANAGESLMDIEVIQLPSDTGEKTVFLGLRVSK